MPDEVIYCEMCGQAIPVKEAKTVFVEGALLRVCSECYSRIMKRGAKTEFKQMLSSVAMYNRYNRAVGTSRLSKHHAGMAPRTSPSRRKRMSLEKYELVEDFAERIRKARERLGWSTKMLAMKVKESETTIRRIESGKLRPTLDLAKRLEEVLGVKLLVPAVEEEISSATSGHREYVTLGEVVNLREE